MKGQTMRYLARNIQGNRPRWWTNAGWGSFADAVVFNSGREAAKAINGNKSFEDGESYLLEVFGGKN